MKRSDTTRSKTRIWESWLRLPLGNPETISRPFLWTLLISILGYVLFSAFFRLSGIVPGTWISFVPILSLIAGFAGGSQANSPRNAAIGVAVAGVVSHIFTHLVGAGLNIIQYGDSALRFYSMILDLGNFWPHGLLFLLVPTRFVGLLIGGAVGVVVRVRWAASHP